ncbi:reverse transcriptase domain-containing protein [Tanacetum coccineum]
MAQWSFYKWGIDIAGPFLEGPGKVKFLIVAMDYFTKWIEAKAVATITGNQVKKFVWDNIVCRFSLPGEIVSDNEAVIPSEIGMPTYRTAVVDAVHNDEVLRLNLDLLEEQRKRAAIRKPLIDKEKVELQYKIEDLTLTFKDTELFPAAPEIVKMLIREELPIAKDYLRALSIPLCLSQDFSRLHSRGQQSL